MGGGISTRRSTRVNNILKCVSTIGTGFIRGCGEKEPECTIQDFDSGIRSGFRVYEKEQHLRPEFDSNTQEYKPTVLALNVTGKRHQTAEWLITLNSLAHSNALQVMLLL